MLSAQERYAKDLEPLLRPLAFAVEDPANARLHPEESITALKASLARYGQVKPVVYWRDATGQPTILAGNGTFRAAQELGWSKLAMSEFIGTEREARGYAIVDNRTPELAQWDPIRLQTQLDELSVDWEPAERVVWAPMPNIEFAPAPIGPPAAPSPNDRDMSGIPREREQAMAEEFSTERAPTRTRSGDLWILGRHRVLCGDSTKSDLVQFLCASDRPTLLHADPPYGMNKGFANDHLHGRDLDTFQTAWWNACRPVLPANASAYVWGCATDLWRWWFDFLETSETLSFRNEIVWDKGGQPGMCSPEMRCFPPNTERCIFFMLGDQSRAVNAGDYWEGWEPLRLALCGEMDRAGWTPEDVCRITDTSAMFKHWFSKNQWTFLAEKHYAALQAAGQSAGVFQHPYSAVRAVYEQLNARFQTEVGVPFRASRPYFDNAHDKMGEVWCFPRVAGAERPDHETPKPVALMERIIRSSTPEEGAVLEPFIGSGSTLLAAENTGRRCFGIEIEPRHVDTTLTRWETQTGMKAEKA